jgi:hypothetical protein
MAIDVSYTEEHIYLTYVSGSQLNIKVYHHSFQDLEDGGGGSLTSNYFNVFGTHANNDNTLDIAILEDNTTSWRLRYIRFNRLGGSTSPVTIHEFDPSDVADVCIERDGAGNLCAFWSQESPDSTSISQNYSLSTDNGATWTSYAVPWVASESAFVDGPTGRLAGRNVLLGGQEGFELGYVRKVNVGGTLYDTGKIRELWRNPDNSYDLSGSFFATNVPTTGFRFFRPENNQLTVLQQLQEVRIAYQVGHATSTVQVDASPVTFAQAKLAESSSFWEIEDGYEEDLPEQNQLLVHFNFLRAPSENIDYVEAGLVGAITRKYHAAFIKVGTSTAFYRYEPNPDAESNDRSAYDNPASWVVEAVMDPISYDFPLATGNEEFKTHIERDTRKIYVPSAFHLGRTFVVNRGNHLKRTVWLCRFDGNEYEISQVIPRFIDDEIVYYEANAYVVGPSNDPFSRVVLPSET